MQNLAAELRRRRRAADLTQRHLATLANISPRSLAAYESGEAIPRADAFARLADALGCSLDDLGGREPEAVA